MGQEVSNKGITGIDSIRLKGMSIDTLPMAEAAAVKQAWPGIIEDNARQEKENLLSQYPTVSIVYIDSRIVECDQNIDRIRKLIASQNAMINEYIGQISLCKYRDKEMVRLNEAPEIDLAAVKALKKRFPLYNVMAMERQVTQCRESIERSEEVITKEYASIVELREVRGKCQERDNIRIG